VCFQKQRENSGGTQQKPQSQQKNVKFQPSKKASQAVAENSDEPDREILEIVREDEESDE
jgi:restriction endonuclease Mrr